MKKTSNKVRSVEKILDKKLDKIPHELKKIIIDTSASPVKKSSTKILNELRYGKN